MLRATSALSPGHGRATKDTIILVHDERRLRRKLLIGTGGTEVLVDFANTTTLDHEGALDLEDGTAIAIMAAPELLYAIEGRDTAHLVRLAWHIGNRHTSAQLEDQRLLIKRDHVLRAMLEGLGAKVSETTEPFFAEHGAYHSHGSSEPAHVLLAR